MISSFLKRGYFILILSALLYNCRIPPASEKTVVKIKELHHIDTQLYLNQGFYEGAALSLPLPPNFGISASDNVYILPDKTSFRIIGIDTGTGYAFFHYLGDTFYKFRISVAMSAQYDSFLRIRSSYDTTGRSKDYKAFYDKFNTVHLYRDYELVNKPLPDFKAISISGGYIDKGYITGKPAIISYWSVKCLASEYLIKDLEKLYPQYQSRISFFSFYADSAYIVNKTQFFCGKLAPITKEGNGQGYKCVDGYNIPYPIAINTRPIVYTFGHLTGGTPTTYFVDKAGIVRYIINGYGTSPKAYEHFKSVLDFFMRIENYN